MEVTFDPVKATLLDVLHDKLVEAHKTLYNLETDAYIESLIQHAYPKEYPMTATTTNPTTPTAESLAAALAATITAQEPKKTRATRTATPPTTTPVPTPIATGRANVKRAKLTGVEIQARRELARSVTGYDNTSPIWGQNTSTVVQRALSSLRAGDQADLEQVELLLNELLKREATNTLTFSR